MPEKVVRPLDGVRVISLEVQVSAPFCTMMLADQGAEVIKIEPPGKGEVSRELAPMLRNEKGDQASGYFARFNRNKKSVAVDLRTEEGIQIVKSLVKNADVFVENLRPGAVDRLGLGYEALKEINPSLIYAAISGFGKLPEMQGPWSERPAYDIIAQGMGGLMDLIGNEGGPPLHPRIAFGDVVPGMLTAYSVCLGLLKRKLNGQGDFIDIAMYDVIMTLAERSLSQYTFTGQVMTRGIDKLIYPWGAFKAKDGYVTMIVAEARMWKRFCQAIERPDLAEDPGFDTAAKRAARYQELQKLIEDWMVERTTDEVVEKMLEIGMPCGPVMNAKEVCDSEQTKARKMLIKAKDPRGIDMTLIGSPIKMKSIPAATEVAPPPLVGEHNQEVLKSIGYSDAQIADLVAKGVL